MRLTRQTEIAIDILFACAQLRNSIILTADAARKAHTSKDHATHIVRLLMRSGFLFAERGRYGGIGLAIPVEEIPLDVLRHVQPDLVRFAGNGDGDNGRWTGMFSRSEVVLWLIAGLAVFLAHGGIWLWLTREPPIEVADNAPPPAIMIELAPEPEVIETETNEITEQAENALEAKSEAKEPVEEPQEEAEQPVPEEVQPEEPKEEIAETEPQITPEPEIDPVEQEIVTQMENVEVPIPVFRPKPPEKEKPVEKPKPKKQDVVQKPKRDKPALKSKASTQASAQVTQSNRNAANQNAAAMGFGSVSPAKWQSRLMAHLERRKRYPSGARSRREEGTAYVRLRNDDAGNVLSASLARSSGFPELDNAVVESCLSCLAGASAPSRCQQDHYSPGALYRQVSGPPIS